jgi:hypothetical protein
MENWDFCVLLCFSSCCKSCLLPICVPTRSSLTKQMVKEVGDMHKNDESGETPFSSLGESDPFSPSLPYFLLPAYPHSPYISHPSKPSLVRTASSWCFGANSARNSSASHSSSSSSSDGLSRPPTLARRSRSAALASRSCCSFSTRKSSALSSANSLREMRKSRRFSRNLSYCVLSTKRLSTKAAI